MRILFDGLFPYLERVLVTPVSAALVIDDRYACFNICLIDEARVGRASDFSMVVCYRFLQVINLKLISS